METDGVAVNTVLQRVDLEYGQGNLTGTERYTLRSGLRALATLQVSFDEFQRICAGLRGHVIQVFADLFASGSSAVGVR